jgi:membrane-bound inhibitor of C-type lysozyme
MIRLLSLAALLALAGCNSQTAEVPTGDQPNEAVVEGTLENEQANLDTEIAADAEADQNEGAGQMAATVSYSCEDGTQVSAVYGTDDGTARVTIAAKTFALLGVPAASGNKYHSDEGPRPGQSFTWWTKGDGAMLIQAPKGAAEGSKGETIVNCTESD